MALENYHIRKIDYATAMGVIVREHYLHRKAPCSVAFGLFLAEELKGVVCYGTPSSAPLRSGIAGPAHACNVAELTRLWVCDSSWRRASVVNVNWTIDGVSKHCQTLADKYTAEQIRAEFGDRFSLQERPRKHRYVFINAKGRRRAEILSCLRYRPEPYPKAPM